MGGAQDGRVDLVGLPYVEALLVDPRPTFILDLDTSKGHLDRARPAKPVFYNSALENNRQLRHGVSVTTWGHSIAVLDFQTLSSVAFLGLEWTAFTVQNRWRVVSATSVPIDEVEAPDQVSLVHTGHTIEASKMIVGSSAHCNLVRNFDWASTRIGLPIQNWPPQLVEMCNLMLTIPQPSIVLWGPDLVFIYNEASIPILGDKHPAILGKRAEDAYPEVWNVHFGKSLQSVMRTGLPVTSPDTHLCIVKNDGVLEEGFFTASYIPIIGPERTAVGVFETFHDVTDQHLWKRRNDTLLQLNTFTAPVQNLGNIWSLIKDSVESNVYDIPQLLLYSARLQTDPTVPLTATSDGVTCVLETFVGFKQSIQHFPFGSFNINDEHGLAPLFRRSTESVMPTYFDRRDLALSSAFWDTFGERGWPGPVTKLVVLPIRPNSQSVVAFALLALNPRLPIDNGYKEFLHFLQAHVSSSAASVLLREEELRRQRIEAEKATYDLRLKAQMHELRFARFAETAPVGIATYTTDGTLLWANKYWHDMMQMPEGAIVEGPAWWSALIYHEDLDFATAQSVRLIQNKEPVKFEMRFKKWSDNPDPSTKASYRWILLDAYHEENETGPGTVVACYTDITDQKNAEEYQSRRLSDAVEAKRQIENFIDITSHEIRNPLSAVLQCGGEIVTLCGDSLKITQENIRHDVLKDILDAAETILYCTLHQKRIVDDILTLSKVESGLLPMMAEPAQPVSVLEGVLKIFERELRASEVEMHFHVDESFTKYHLDWVQLDTSRFSQMVINLVSNSLKFTKAQKHRRIDVRIGASMGKEEGQAPWPMNFLPRPPVTNENGLRAIWTADDSVHLHFSVQDTGGGMSEEECKLLFARFRQASPRTHVQYGGSGLGLYICRALCEMHNGQIGVISRAGEGSTFAFYIEVGRYQSPKDIEMEEQDNPTSPFKAALTAPLVNAIMPPSTRDNIPVLRGENPCSAAATAPTPGFGKHTILLVEDNVINQRVVSRQLMKLGHTVLIAQHGQEALDILKTTRLWKGNTDGPHLSFILMDVEMPVMDGLTCSSTIRTLQRQGDVISHIPIVAITGNARDEKVKAVKESGMDDVILKPFTVPKVMDAAEKLLRKHKSPSDP